jgi:peptide/nickel transport system substrate-binding protein
VPGVSQLRRPLVLMLALLLVACAGPSSTTSPQPGQSSDGQAPGQPARTGPRTIRLAVHEPIEVLYGETANVAREIGEMFNSSLTYYDASGNLLPRLAQKVPSVSDGDWKVDADGSMEVTWKLKPNLKWHDGTPLTSEDFAFCVRMFKDPASRFSVPRSVRFVDEVQTPDPQTMVFRYRQIFNGAANAVTYDFPPVPRHLLADTYAQGGAEQLANSPVWTSGWVGLGPFKLTNFVPGNQLDAEAFPDYVFGRPQIDRLSLRIIPDVNTIVANLLAGELDAVTTGSLEAGHASDLKRQWEAQGRGTIGIEQNRIRQMQLQFRDPSLPWASDVRVRQAAIQLIDRQAIVDSIVSGVTTVADVAALPNSPIYPVLQQRGVTKYPFDRTAGERLLDQAGWARGADGVRRNAAGTVFTWNPAVSGDPDLPEVLVIVDGFKASGISSEPDLIPDSLSSNDKNERRARSHSITRSSALDQSYWDRFLRAEIASQDNRYRTANTGGYNANNFETAFDQWRVALDPNARVQREAELHKILLDDVAYIPLFYNVDVFAFRKGVTGPKINNSDSRSVSIDIHTWKLE